MHKEKFHIYRRDARKDSPAYSPKPHSAPHYESSYIEGDEWASWYCINKKDDGTYLFSEEEDEEECDREATAGQKQALMNYREGLPQKEGVTFTVDEKNGYILYER